MSGKIIQKGPWYRFGEEKFMGRQAVVDFFEKTENIKTFEDLKTEILDT